MAEINIRLIYNLNSGKKDIHIDYESDDDALPIEHEQHHRQIVESLLGQKIVTEDDLGELIINREQTSTPQAQQQNNPDAPEQESANQ